MSQNKQTITGTTDFIDDAHEALEAGKVLHLMVASQGEGYPAAICSWRVGNLEQLAWLKARLLDLCEEIEKEFREDAEGGAE